MNSVIQFGLPEVVKQIGVRLSHVAEFEAEPLSWIWDERIPSHREDKAWLDEHTPGWRTVWKARALVQRDLPIGADEVGTFKMYEVSALFRTAAHRHAWQKRQAEIRADRQRLAERVAAARLSAPDGVQVCRGCASHMEPRVIERELRVSQFSFSYKLDGHHCVHCGTKEHLASEVISEVIGRAKELVGLPKHGDKDFNDDVLAEHKRRRSAPPVVTVRIEREMTADDVIRLLTIGLQMTGSPTSPPIGVVEDR